MKGWKFLCVACVCLVAMSPAYAQQVITKHNIQNFWQIYDGTTYKPYTAEADATTVYFTLHTALFSNDYLTIRANHPVTVFVNNTILADQVKQMQLPVDSLQKIYGTDNLFLAVRSTKHISGIELHTLIETSVLVNAATSDQNFSRSRESFRDFSITAIIVLVVFLVVIVRINPGLSSDYFSIPRVFSFRESEDDHYYYRVTSAAILFYVFTAMLTGFYTIVVGRFINLDLGIKNIETTAYGMLLWGWLRVSLYLMVIVLAKFVVIYLMSALFGIRDIAGYHFFNFIRVFLISISLLTVVLVFYYVPYGQRTGFYEFLFAVVPWILGGWIVLSFFKLSGRMRHSAFYLFSYICATELIPFLIILKVLKT